MAWYVVFRGRNPGIYKDWPSCLAQVSRFKGNVYQKFSSQAEAISAYNSFRMKEDVMVQPGQIVQPRPAAGFSCSWKDLLIIALVFANVVLMYTTLSHLAKK